MILLLLLLAQIAPWNLDRIDARYGLDGAYNYAATGKGVTVYVVDADIPDLPDFEGRVKKGYGREGDCDGHATAVAAVVSSQTYGVAKDVTIVPVRVRCTGGAFLSDILKGLHWITRQKARPAVAVIPLGSTRNFDLDNAVQRVINSGVTVVVAAGNEGSNACNYSPSAVPEAITVGGTNKEDEILYYSNSGPCVDLYAPGEGVATWWNTGVQTFFSGTSSAAPHVAGIVALYLETHPNASPSEVHGAIVNNATPLSDGRLAYSNF